MPKSRRFSRRVLAGAACMLLVLGRGDGIPWQAEIAVHAEEPSGSDAPRAAVPAGGWLDALAGILSGQVRDIDARRAAIQRRLATKLAAPGNASGACLGYHSRMSRSPLAEKWVQVDLQDSVEFDTVVLVAPQAPQSDAAEPRHGFPLRFRIDVADDPKFEHSRRLIDETAEDYPNPGVYPAIFRTTGGSGRYVRVTATKQVERQGLALLALGELMVLRGPRNVALNKPVTAFDSVENPPDWSQANLVDGRLPNGPPLGRAASPGNGYHSSIANSADATKWVQVDLGETRALDEVLLLPAHPRDFPDRLGFGFPVRFRVELSDDPEFQQSTTLADQTAEDYPNPGSHAVMIPAGGAAGRYVRVTATRLWQRTGDYCFALAELQALADGQNVAQEAKVSALDSIDAGAWARTYLVDGFGSQHQLLSWPDWLAQLDERHACERQLNELEVQRRRATDAVAARSTRFAGGGVLVLAAALGGVSWRSRRRRRREIEQLRDRIARDLHDEIGSNLGSIALLSQLAAARVPAEQRPQFEQINAIARETADSMRDIVWLLSPESDAPQELSLRFRDTAAALLAQIEYDFQSADDAWPREPSPEFKRQTLLIFKEALHNVARHSQASHVSIRVFQERGAFQVEIRDNGRGFDPATAAGGTGLRSMRHRAESLGGVLEIVSRPGQGVTLHLAAPIA